MSDPRFTNTTDPRFANWRKSTRSSGGNECLYVSESAGLVAVADSKAGPDAPVRVFDRSAWAAFVAATKAGTLV
jgi:hypothetical protein